MLEAGSSIGRAQCAGTGLAGPTDATSAQGLRSRSRDDARVTLSPARPRTANDADTPPAGTTRFPGSSHIDVQDACAGLTEEDDLQLV
jgi:hypothetical protein